MFWECVGFIFGLVDLILDGNGIWIEIDVLDNFIEKDGCFVIVFFGVVFIFDDICELCFVD